MAARTNNGLGWWWPRLATVWCAGSLSKQWLGSHLTELGGLVDDSFDSDVWLDDDINEAGGR